MRAAIVLLICLVALTPADAQQCPDPALATREARSKSIQEQTDKIAKAINGIEAVTPAQVAYFESEERHLKEDPVKNSARYQAVQNSSAYRAYSIRNSYGTLRGSLARAEVALTVRDQAYFIASGLKDTMDLYCLLESYANFDCDKAGYKIDKSIGSCWNKAMSFVGIFGSQAVLYDALLCAIFEMREP
jgi:hypothetical protein